MFEYSSVANAAKERTLIKNVYLWMAFSLALTGLASLWMMSDMERVLSFCKSGTMWILLIAEFALVFLLSARIFTMRTSTATLYLVLYSIINGITLSPICLAYTAESLTSTFFVTAATFAGMCLYASTTKRDLGGFAQYLGMALWGLIIAGIVNMFLKSGPFDSMISFVGVLVFCGLTAFDTQYLLKMSRSYSNSIAEEDFVRLSIIGALKLYLDFINMFLYLLRLFGRRND